MTLGGCTAQYISPEPTVAASFAPWTETAPDHRLGADDEVEIKFLLNTELNDRLVIGPDGKATFPLLGPIVAGGHTVPELSAQLKQLYAPKLRVPEFDLVVRAYRSERIYVGGEVTTPGPITLTGRVNALSGVLMAGGFKDTARTGEVIVIRRNPDNQLMLRTVDVKHLISRAASSEDFPLQASDVVFVPRSDIAEVDLFVEQYINNVLPFQRSLSLSNQTTN
ncbi:MAG TPA: polysaccharide biosynthesis/export family protein [Stellaceae bacterium]|nr:polysaccharide biosynthesis/export family protein [Stellaceae bacterium]